MNRRQLLQLLAAAPVAGLSGTLFAAPGAGAKSLLVFLRGGVDAANVLVPVSSDFYYESRPNIAVARPGSASDAALRLDADWGLHPALKDSIAPLFQARQAAFIPFAGTDDVSRSHFETQDSIELGQALNGARNYQSGFLNRLAAVLQGRCAIAFTDQLPLIFRGGMEVPNMALRQLGKPGLDPRQSAIISAMYQGNKLARQVAEGFGVRDEVLKDMAAEMDAASRNASTSKGFEQESRRIASLMRDKYSLGFVDIGGWDTHVGEGGASGYLAGRLDELGRGLAAFADEMGPHWADTVVIVISEFGRTFRENGNRGTDHGHGTAYWLLGGGLAGGRMAGEQVRVEHKTLFQDRDYPVLNEYRAVLGGVYQRLFGLSTEQLARVFPGAKARDLGLI